MKKKLKQIGLLLLTCITFNANAQWSWVSKSSSTSVEISKSIHTDNLMNTYTIGSFSSTATFGSFTLSATSNANFLVKQGVTGDYIWAVKILNASIVSVKSTGTDVFIAGYCSNNSSFLSTNTTAIPTTINGRFIAKYNASGIVQWVKQISNGTSQFFSITDMAISNSTQKKIFITGRENSNFYISCYDNAGTLLWNQKSTGNPADENIGFDLEGRIVSDNADNCYLLQQIDANNGGAAATNPFTFSNSPVITNIDPNNSHLFLTKLNSNGTYAWGQILCQVPLSVEYNGGIGLDGANNIYISGAYGGPSIISGTALTSAPTPSIFIAKYSNSGGAPIWVKQVLTPASAANGLGGLRSPYCSVDNSGNVFISCIQDGSTSIGNCFTFNNTNTNDNKLIVLKYNSLGSLDWAVSPILNPNSICNITNDGTGAAIICTTTGAPGTYSFGPFSLVTLPPLTNTDVIVAKFDATPKFPSYSICSGNFVTLTPSGPTPATFNWYTSATATIPVFTGSSYITPILNATTTYYVSTVLPVCESVRVPVTVSVKPSSVVNAGPDKTICGTGCVTIGAVGGARDETLIFSWSNGTTVIPNSNSPTLSVCPTVTSTYTLTLTNTTTGCTYSDVVIVFVNNISPSFSATSTIISGGSSSYSINASATITNTAGIVGFVNQWIVEEVTTPTNTTVAGSISTLNCWATNLTTNFSGYDGVAFANSGTNPNLSCASPSTGLFKSGRSYKITRKVSSNACAVQTDFVIKSGASGIPNNRSITIISSDTDKEGYKLGTTSNIGDNPVGVYPNPSKGLFSIDINTATEGTVEIYNALGNKVKSIAVSSDEKTYQLDLSAQSKGMYLVIYKSEGKSYTKKIVVE